MRHLVSRRRFLVSSVVGGVSARGVLARPAWAAPLGANDAVRVAVVGLGNPGKGRHHVEMFKALPGVRVVALCDVDEAMLDSAVKDLASENIQVATYVDVRKLLESKEVDAISIATPNHWHSLMAIWACQAGKDVYVEKPVSHNVWEGRKVVEAAAQVRPRSSRRARSRARTRRSSSWRTTCAAGETRQDPPRSRLLLQAPREHRQGRRAAADPRRASTTTCGAGRRRSSRCSASSCTTTGTGLGHRQRRHRQPGHPRDGHVPVDAGRGDAAAPGVQRRRPLRLRRRRRDAEHADRRARLPAAPLLFEVRGLPQKTGVAAMDHYRGVRVGIAIECENGYFAGGGGGGWTYDRDGKRVKQFAGSGGDKHVENFVEAVRSRKAAGTQGAGRRGPHLLGVVSPGEHLASTGDAPDPAGC